MKFPAYCTFRQGMVDDTRCLRCFYSPLEPGSPIRFGHNRRRLDCCAANLKPVGRDAPEPVTPITAEMIAGLDRGQLIACVGNCLCVAQGPDQDCDAAIRTLQNEIRLHASGVLV